jgi:hypothetical protein
LRFSPYRVATSQSPTQTQTYLAPILGTLISIFDDEHEDVQDGTHEQCREQIQVDACDSRQWILRVFAMPEALVSVHDRFDQARPSAKPYRAVQNIEHINHRISVQQAKQRGSGHIHVFELHMHM